MLYIKTKFFFAAIQQLFFAVNKNLTKIAIVDL